MFKKFLHMLKKPCGWALIPLYILTAACIACAIVFGLVLSGSVSNIVAYIFYALAAITLAYSIYTLVVFIPEFKKKIREKLKANKFTASVMESYEFKTIVFAALSFAITIGFATMNLVSAIMYRLIWYGAIAAYYFVLVLFRGGVLYAYKKCAEKFGADALEYEKSKWKIYLVSGAFLILLEFAMMGAVTQMMLSEHPAKSGEIMTITNAAYTFYKVIMAVYNLIKARKFSNPVTQSFRNLNFADACMSVVSITVLMISTFDSTDSSTTMHFMKCTVGFAACVVIIAIASVMILKANKKLKTFKQEKESKEEKEQYER